jgi:hypothetical protein
MDHKSNHIVRSCRHSCSEDSLIMSLSCVCPPEEAFNLLQLRTTTSIPPPGRSSGSTSQARYLTRHTSSEAKGAVVLLYGTILLFRTGADGGEPLIQAVVVRRASSRSLFIDSSSLPSVRSSLFCFLGEGGEEVVVVP